MNTTRMLSLMLLSTGIVCAQPPAQNPAAPAAGKLDAAAEISALQASYEKAIMANAAEQEKWVAGLDKWYLDGLDKLQAERAKAADLDGAALVKAEHDRIAGHSETSAEQIQAMPPAMRTLRGTYEGSLKKITEEVGKRNLPASRKYFADLEALQKRITVTGDIEQALVVKAEKERFAAQFATSVPKPAATSAPVAKPPPVVAAKDAPIASAEDLINRLIGTKWIWFNRETITFLADGKAKWKLSDDPWPWKVTSFSRRVIEGENMRRGNKFIMTLDRGLKTGTIVETNGGAPRKTRDITNE
jgi:hypothetical protein